MPRAARDSDAQEIRQWLADFGLDVTLAKLRRRRRTHIVQIEPGVGYAELQLRPGDIKVSSLFPRGTDAELLQPSLARTFLIARGKILADGKDPDTTPVWARFFGGVDENGVPDGGESECRRWHALYPVTVLVEPDEPGGLWEIRATLGDLL